MGTYLSPMSDVADICDELRDHINEDQNISVNVDFDGDPIEMQWVIAAVSVLTKITDGVLYVEGMVYFFQGIRQLKMKEDSEYN